MSHWSPQVSHRSPTLGTDEPPKLIINFYFQSNGKYRSKTEKATIMWIWSIFIGTRTLNLVLSNPLLLQAITYLMAHRSQASPTMGSNWENSGGPIILLPTVRTHLCSSFSFYNKKNTKSLLQHSQQDILNSSLFVQRMQSFLKCLIWHNPS